MHVSASVAAAVYAAAAAASAAGTTPTTTNTNTTTTISTTSTSTSTSTSSSTSRAHALYPRVTLDEMKSYIWQLERGPKEWEWVDALIMWWEFDEVWNAKGTINYHIHKKIVTAFEQMK
jgi:hypothetical protein